MITYEKKNCCPNEKDTVGIYVYVLRNEEDVGKIFISKNLIDYTELEMIARTPEEVEEWLTVLRIVWQMKIIQDAKGWAK